MKYELQLDEFELLLNQFSADLSLWPREVQHQARALCNDNPAAEALLLAEQTVAEGLTSMEQLSPGSSLQRRVAEIPLRLPAAEAASWSWAFWRRAWIGAFASVGLGVLAGALSFEVSPLGSELNAQAEWDELAALALAADYEEDLP